MGEQTTRLTLLATAAGFDTSAKDVDVLAESRKQTEALQTAKPSVHIETFQPNAKNFGADADSFQSRVRNGASRATDAEGW